MGKKSRTKGAVGEREAIQILNRVLGDDFKLRRNLEQYQEAEGYDIVGLDAFAVEVKRYQTISHAMLSGFWAETCRQAAKYGLIPVLMYRADRCPWRLVHASQPALRRGAYPDYPFTVDVSPEMFALAVRIYLAAMDNEAAGRESMGSVH